MVVVVGHLEKLLVSDKSHVKHGKTHLFAKSLFSGLVGLGEKFEFFEVPIIVFSSAEPLVCPSRAQLSSSFAEVLGRQDRRNGGFPESA